jgi:cytochrome P450
MMPFGGGPRLCPGRYLAIVEMKAVLCLLAARFSVVPSHRPMATERLAFTTKPEHVELGLRRRIPSVPRAG